MLKTVLITGGATGIGKACAKEFANLGYRVAICYNQSADEAVLLKSELISMGCDAECFRADLTNHDSANNLVNAVAVRFGSIDVLVNNAGISQQKLFTDITIDDWNRMMSVNVTTVFNVTHAVVPYMVNKKWGRIINISSMWGVTGASCEVHYSASKAAVIGLTKALSKELAPSGVLVNAVAPGAIDTKMNDNLLESDKIALCEEIPLGRFGTATEVAKSVAFLVSDEASYITGQILGVNGGLVI